MRSIAQIICAVQDCEWVSYEEATLALVALSSIEQFGSRKIRELAEEIEKTIEKVSAGHAGSIHNVPLKMRLKMAEEHAEFRFKALRNDPKSYLGPDSTPGTPEQISFHKMALNLLKRVDKSEQDLRVQLGLSIGAISSALSWIKRELGNVHLPRQFKGDVKHNGWSAVILPTGEMTLEGALEGFKVKQVLISHDGYFTEPPFESIRLGQVFLELFEKVKYYLSEAQRVYFPKHKLPYLNDGTIKQEK